MKEGELLHTGRLLLGCGRCGREAFEESATHNQLLRSGHGRKHGKLTWSYSIQLLYGPLAIADAIMLGDVHQCDCVESPGTRANLQGKKRKYTYF